MAGSSSDDSLQKDLGLFDVYAVALGTTLSSGFFLLPGLAFAATGPLTILCYLAAGILVIPPMLSMTELATAMPRAGGAYYYLDRSMGPLVGTVGGIGTWLVLVLKTAFVLIGMGAYIELFWGEIPILAFATLFALGLGGLNLIGAKETGRFQVALVWGLLLLLVWFSIDGGRNIEQTYFTDFFRGGGHTFFATTGLVYISYAGLTKITSIAEEVAEPERNIPLGMFLALITAVLAYGVGTAIMIGNLEPETLSGNLTPAATAAVSFAGEWGGITMTVAALLAFFSAANAGIFSASRYPLAMSRDRLMSPTFRQISSRGIPNWSVLVTVGAVIAILLAVDAMKIAKLASAFQLLMFSMMCVAVIVMRESGLASYDPGYRSPLYPWMQIAGLVVPLWIITEMGWMPVLFSLGMVGVAMGWYLYYARDEVHRQGAIYHVFHRLGEHRFEPLDRELREIMKEKGVREHDPYHDLILHSQVVDIDSSDTGDEVAFESLIERCSTHLARKVQLSTEELEERFLENSGLGNTPVMRGVALPHIRLDSVSHPHLLIVRIQNGLPVGVVAGSGPYDSEEDIYAAFFLVSPWDDASMHLRILAELARSVESASFIDEWRAAETKQQLREILLDEEQYVAVTLEETGPTSSLIGRRIREVAFPDDAIVAIIHRDGNAVIPKGHTMLEVGDRLTVLGEPSAIDEIKVEYLREVDQVT